MAELTAQQNEAQMIFRAFAAAEVAPQAGRFDREERIPAEMIDKLAQEGYLGALIPQEYGGAGLDMVTFGLLNEAIGQACSSTRSLLTVHSMVSFALLRWGSVEQKTHWLPQLAGGAKIAAFALTEPDAGSDAQNIATQAEQQGNEYVLTGEKTWITYGQIADLFLVFAKCEDKATAFLVERDRTGLETEPIRGLLGNRASLVAKVHLRTCRVPEDNLLGGVGFGLSAIGMSALDIGRYSVAWGSVGLGQACLEASLTYADQRRQFGRPLRSHQLIQRMLTNMIVNVEAARLLCLRAGHLHDANDPTATLKTLQAKYFGATMAAAAASDAVQIHGGNGCGSEYPVQRYLRDAKINEIIEGSNEMHQMMISKATHLERCRP